MIRGGTPPPALFSMTLRDLVLVTDYLWDD